MSLIRTILIFPDDSAGALYPYCIDCDKSPHLTHTQFSGISNGISSSVIGGKGFSCEFGTKSEFYLFDLDQEGNPTARTKKILDSTPSHRFVDPEELLGATFFLCDEKAASAVTGVVIPVDAGFSAYSGV